MEIGDKVICELGLKDRPKGSRGCWREISGILVSLESEGIAVVELLENDFLTFFGAGKVKGETMRVYCHNIKLATDVVEEW